MSLGPLPPAHGLRTSSPGAWAGRAPLTNSQSPWWSHRDVAPWSVTEATAPQLLTPCSSCWEPPARSWAPPGTSHPLGAVLPCTGCRCAVSAALLPYSSPAAEFFSCVTLRVWTVGPWEGTTPHATSSVFLEIHVTLPGSRSTCLSDCLRHPPHPQGPVHGLG